MKLIIFTSISILLIFSSIALNSIENVSKENLDLIFILSLYENNQYDLAKKQIDLYEINYKNSEHITTVLFIKANIEFMHKNYIIADSLYALLLTYNITNDILIDTIINRSIIKMELGDLTSALGFLNNADLLSANRNQKYMIELNRGRIYSKMFNFALAQEYIERSLVYKTNDKTAIEELLILFLKSNNILKADELVNKILTSNNNIAVYYDIFNTWIDYLIANDKYQEVIAFYNRLRTLNYESDDSIKLRIAKVNYLLKQHGEALKLIALCSTYEEYRMYLTGLILVDQGKITEADSIFAILSKGEIRNTQSFSGFDRDVPFSSWLERIKLYYNEEPDEAISILKDYLDTNIEASNDPYLLYTYSSLLFKSKRYQEAINSLLLTKKLAVTNELNHNIQIMIGDIWFNAGELAYSQQAYNNYLNLYPFGKFREHALYNIAYINYEFNNFEESAFQLNMLIESTQNKEYIDKSNYMLAEIDFQQSNYNLAIQRYKNMKTYYISMNNLNYRLAQSYYYLEMYPMALDYVSKIDIDSTTGYKINLLKGNIYFNLRQFETALKLYNDAKSYANSDIDLQEINSYIALTFYRLRRFNEATEMYLSLTKDIESPEAYIMMAAKSSYHARDYKQSLFLFNQFIVDYPNSDYYNYAIANIGSIYYNQGNYEKAKITWLYLLNRYKIYTYFEAEDQSILTTLFSGLLWVLKQNPDQKILKELGSLVDEFDSEYLKFETQYMLLRIYFGTGQWNDIIKMADELRKEFPQKENNEIRRYVAASLTNLNRATEADSIYRKIFELEPTAEVLTEWSELELQIGNYSQAIARLEQAINIDNKPQRFDKLISVLYIHMPDSLGFYWQKWRSSFNDLLDETQFTWMNWNFERNIWEIAKQNAFDLLLNPDYRIRSKAQFVYGKSFFNLNDYDNAIMELYRFVFLYPESSELILDAKKSIIKIHAIKGNEKDANYVFEEIRLLLNSDEQQELQDFIKGKTR